MVAAPGCFDPTANSFDNPKAPRRPARGPSKRCEGCRHRKIKCDETHPVCSNCLVRGDECHYRDFSLLIFRDETQRAARKVRQREQRALAPELFKRPLLPVRQTAITRFFHDFVLEQIDPNGGYYTLISLLYRNANPDSCFRLALSAVANANFWRRQNSSQAQVDSLEDYGKALQQLRKDLQPDGKLHANNNADMLATSSLLAMHQLLISRDISHGPCWSAHVNGAMALVGVQDKKDPSLRQLARTSIFEMLIDCLIAARHPRLSLEECTSILAPASAPAALLGFMYRTAQLHASWKEYCRAAGSAGAEPQNFAFDGSLAKAQLLDEQVEHWMQTGPDLWAVKPLENTQRNVPAPLRALFTHPGAPTTLHLCADMHQTQRWQFYRACRLSISVTMMEAADKALLDNAIGGAHADHYTQILARIRSRTIELVDGLLSTIFSTLCVNMPGRAEPQSITDIEGFRGLQLLWPLHTAGMCLMNMGPVFPKGVEKLQWVRSLFRCIRDELGIQGANNFLQAW